MKWFDAAAIPGVIIGGVAASVLGRPRLTRDIDALVMIPDADWPAVMSLAANFGIVARDLPASEPASRSPLLRLRHAPSDIDIDLALGGLSFEIQVLRLCQIQEVGGLRLRLPRVEDLLVMKAFAHRPKDLEDIDGLLTVHPGVDLEFVRQWLGEFSIAVNTPALLDDFEKVVARRR